jgi:hypothetical protein
MCGSIRRLLTAIHLAPTSSNITPKTTTTYGTRGHHGGALCGTYHADINVTFGAGETAYLVTNVYATRDPHDDIMYCDVDLTVGMKYLLRPSGFVHSNCHAHDSRAQITNSSNEVYMTDLGVCFPYYNYENPSVELLLELATECGRDYNLTHLVQRQQAHDDALYFASQEEG